MLKKNLPLVLLSSLFYCCTANEDVDNKANNFFAINNEKFSIVDAGVSDFGIDPTNDTYNGNSLVLLFVSEGISFNKEANGNLKLEGTGAILGLVTYTNTPNYLEDGNYFLNLRPPYEKGDISIGFYTPFFNSMEVNGPYFDYNGTPLLSGKMSVDQSNESVLIRMNMIGKNGNEITADFEGKLELLDYNLSPKILN